MRAGPGAAEQQGVRYHAPRRRDPGPVLGVAASLLILLVSAQLALAWQPEERRAGPALQAGLTSPDGTAAASPADGGPTATGSPSVAGSSAAALPPVVEVTFDSGADTPVPGATAELDDVVAALQADPGATVKVVGHAEASNDRDLEQQLSLQRALRVVDLLGRRGVPAERAEVVAAGASRAEESSGPNSRVTLEVRLPPQRE